MKISVIQNKIFVILAIIVVCLLAYANVLNDPFHFDDFNFIVDNHDIKTLDNIPSLIKSILPQPSRFIGFLTFALNYKLHGLNVVGYHIVNLLIHILTAFLVWWLVLLLAKTPKANTSLSDADTYLIAFFSALLFASHPVQTQAISYIAQRFASLATLFYLSCVCFFIKGRIVSLNTNLPYFKYYFLSVIAGLFAMFTKEISITLPIIIFIVDRIFIVQKHAGKKYWIAMILIFSSILIVPYMFDFGIKELFFASRESASHAGDTITFSSYLLTQLRVFVTFVRLLFLPYGQNLDYDFALSYSIFELPVLGSLFFIGLLVFWTIKLCKSNRIASFGIIWILITFSPNLIPRRFLIFEHKIYLLSVGFCISLSYLLFQKINNRKVFSVLMVVVVAIMSLLAHMRNRVWSNEITLWSDVVKKSPNKIRPKVNLGNAYVLDRQFEKAIEHFDKALKLNPRHFKAYLSRGVAYENLKKYDKALEDYSTAISLKENYTKAYGNRGFVYDRLKQYDLALADYKRALELEPRMAKIYSNRGVIYKNRKQLDLALSDYNNAIKYDPFLKEAFGNRGVVYFMKGMYDKAIADQNRVIQIDPNNPIPYMNRSFAYFGKNDIIGALKSAQQARSLGFDLQQSYIDMLNKKLKNNQKVGK